MIDLNICRQHGASSEGVPQQWVEVYSRGAIMQELTVIEERELSARRFVQRESETVAIDQLCCCLTGSIERLTALRYALRPGYDDLRPSDEMRVAGVGLANELIESLKCVPIDYAGIVKEVDEDDDLRDASTREQVADLVRVNTEVSLLLASK